MLLKQARVENLDMAFQDSWFQAFVCYNAVNLTPREQNVMYMDSYYNFMNVSRIDNLNPTYVIRCLQNGTCK